MPVKKVVLDTNCLISSLSRKGQYYPVWKGLQTGEYVLCVSTDILEEYAEVITQKMSVQVATNVIHLLMESEFVELVNPYFNLQLMSFFNLIFSPHQMTQGTEEFLRFLDNI